MRRVVIALGVAVVVTWSGMPAASAFECPARIEESKAAVQKAEAAFEKAKAAAKAAARPSLPI